MAEFPYMPMFWDAYFSDTTHLTCLEHGAYLQILGAMWRAGGDLPDDDTTLMRITHLTRSQWKRIRPRIMGFMHPISGGRFTQDKLLETINAVRRKRQSQKDNANARWLKKKGLADAMASSRHMPIDAIPKPNKSSFLLVQSMTPREEKKEVAEREQTNPLELVVSDALASTKMVRRTA